MKYTNYKGNPIEVSFLGMGAMRLPAAKDDKADVEKSIELIRHAIDKGITYVDTAYNYHQGESESIVGKALKDGYREKVILATKLPIWMCRTEEDMERIFGEQLQHLEVECIDNYLIHNIIPYNWKKFNKLGAAAFLDDKKAKGLIKYAGFSFHGNLELFKEVIDAYPWDFCQIQLNYIDADEQAGLEGLKYAKDKGIDVIIMEPLKGGKLTDNVPKAIAEMWESAPAKRTPAQWAFNWLAGQEGILCVLSGMSNIEQLDQNIETFSDDNFGELTAEEMELYAKAANEYNSLIKYQCTGCKYCMPCAAKIDIPSVIDYTNSWYAYGKNDGTYMEYTRWIDKHGSDCIECGECETKCPQSLPIKAIMKDAEEQFGI
ncbi:MAG: aldo/keto reductase [Firmicutes bacterium]|nr:aldo/keto reductase [Bacillota bacterium]